MHGMREWFLESSVTLIASVCVEVAVAGAVISAACLFVKLVLGAVALRDKVRECFGGNCALA